MNHKWAIGQLNSGSDIRGNLSTVTTFISEAAGEGCELIAFPEHFLWRDAPEKIYEEPWKLTAPPLEKISAAARNSSIGVLAGSVPLVGPENENLVYNTSLYIDPGGTITTQYRKIHLFDVNLNNGAIRESEYVNPGQDVVDLQARGVHCGLVICYDLRFPEIFRILAERRVQVIFVPSDFTARTGRAHWEPLLRARAIENQCYVIAPDQVGANPATGVESHGNSLVVDPWGEVIARASDREHWFSFSLDIDYLHEVRKKLPALNHIELRGE